MVNRRIDRKKNITSFGAIKVVTFDCYGTLMDWDKTVKDFFWEILPQFNSERLLEIQKKWEDIQFQLIQEKYRPYEELQNESFARVLNFFGISSRRSLGRDFLNRLLSCEPFSDVLPLLYKLKKHFRLALISNGPFSFLQQHVKQIGVEFDHIISAELVHAYKPHQSIFHEPSESVLHVAAGYKYDVIPVKNLGWNVVWLNRRNELRPGDISSDFEISTLNQFFDQVMPLCGVPHKTDAM